MKATEHFPRFPVSFLSAISYQLQEAAFGREAERL
jgi:hypothetical protein